MKPHWYFITVFYCPICASDVTYRERRYGKKPMKYTDTHQWIDSWDGCNAL